MTNSSCIKPLPVEAQLLLKSSVALNSLRDAIIGLIKNSLDAQARRIHVEVDFVRGNCCVEDDGVGIPAADFGDKGGLGLMHYTSKSANGDETHGRSGQFLASVSASSLLSVSSRHVSEQSESCIVYHHSWVLTRQLNVPEKEQRIEGPSGTRVAVRDLFGNLAVRTKQRAIHFGSIENIEREFDRLRSQIVVVALSWSKPTRITLSLHRASVIRKVAIGTPAKPGERGLHVSIASQRTSNFCLDHICQILSHAGYITPMDFGSWTSVSARTSQMFVRAAISLQPAPSKQVQFISLDIHPLDCSSTLSQCLYREVNVLFAESAFGAVDDDIDISKEARCRLAKDQRFKSAAHTERQSKGSRKGVDRWPMFYIRINPKDGGAAMGVLNSDEDDRQAAKFFEKTVQLISSMIQQFLQEHHFRPRARKHRDGLQSTGKRVNSNRPSLGSLSESRCAPPYLEGCQHVSGALRNEFDRGSANTVSSEEQVKSQRIPWTLPFASWCRVKSGNPRAVEDLFSGLPCSKVPKDLQCDSSEPMSSRDCTGSSAKKEMPQTTWREENLDEDVQSPLWERGKDLDKNNGDQKMAFEQKTQVVTQVTETERHEETCTLGEDNSEDGIIVWRNPLSGNNIRINSRTGLFLPDLTWRLDSEPPLSNPKLATCLPQEIRDSLRSRCIGPRQSNMITELQSEPNSWLSAFLTGWQNPVFRRKERPIQSTAAEHDEMPHGDAHKCGHGHDGRLSKAALESATAVGQIDKKFILVIMKSSLSRTMTRVCSDFEDTALVLVDQHAADERCRVEGLYAQLYANRTAPTGLSKPIVFEVTARESELFRRERTHFEGWGIIYNLSAEEKPAKKNVVGMRPASARPHATEKLLDEPRWRPATAIGSKTPVRLPGRDAAERSKSQVAVHALPEVIVERCRLDQKLLIDLLRSEVWARTENTVRTSTFPLTAEDVQRSVGQDGAPHAWLRDISSCPRGILDLVNSRACRSAIMFNDALTKSECEELLKRLAKCAFPFQCAHGRPSMVAMGGLRSGAIPVSEYVGSSSQTDQKTFIHAFEEWQQQD